jgi:hypothetical protein
MDFNKKYGFSVEYDDEELHKRLNRLCEYYGYDGPDKYYKLVRFVIRQHDNWLTKNKL